MKNLSQQYLHLFEAFNFKLSVLSGFLELAKSSIGWYIEDLEYANKNINNLNKGYPEVDSYTELKNFYARGLKKVPFSDLDKTTKRAIELFIQKQNKDEIKSEKKQLYLYLSEAVISRVWSEIEELLSQLVLLLEQRFGKQAKGWNKKIPRVHFLITRINNYGLLVDLDPKLKKEIDALRAVRNHFVHSLGKDTAVNLIQTSSDSLARIKSPRDITYQFCQEALKTAEKFTAIIREEFDKKIKA